MTTTPTRPLSWLVLWGAGALVLAGCASPATTEPGAGTANSDSGYSDSGTDGNADDRSASGPCPAVPQAGYELFTTDLVTAAPDVGFVYSASSPISFTLSVGAGFLPSMQLSYINDAGDAIVMGEQNLLDNGDGSYRQDLGVFDSDADGRPGFATVTLLNDGSFTPPDGDETFDFAKLGRYCVSFGVE